MADEDSGIDLGEDSETAAAPAKKGGLGGILPTILKYVALALGAIVLIVTVVIITMNVMGGNKTRQTQVPISEEYKEYAEELDWYQSLGEIQTRTSDASHASVLVNIFLGYKKEDKVASAEITAQKIPIRDFLRNYFADKSVEDLSPKNEERLKIEIRNEINDRILNKSKIRKISFDKLQVVVQ
ncbi:MAG: flagellar basal body-associated FliL family protein [Spirochaetia bacterium]|nr:flagellar basal body-associated FliL family protein [Spirochaetia bacterium]MDD7699737.1 flagellar basal body-associated FliL family protein [Spirochaetia bacterium]MDY4211324.1 flagellar basal body-associated FliL family protein [Treponema sp.]